MGRYIDNCIIIIIIKHYFGLSATSLQIFNVMLLSDTSTGYRFGSAANMELF